MDIAKYLTVLVLLCLEGGETGGGGKHHDHVKLHIPEFHHHDHHKKVITIHHHHHKPKKEHHHHHHHHHKPHVIPHGHHYSHNHKKVHLKTTTVAKGHGHGHGSHGHHHKHHGHHGHHGHHHGHHGHHGHSHHHDAPYTPSYDYTPNAIPSYENDFPSGPSYDSGIPITGFTSPQVPQVHGISHTVKQVKVFDSLPGALPNRDISHGYEVTEEGEEGDEAFVPLNNIQNSYPGTFGYVRSAASEATNDPFGGIPIHIAAQQSHNPFSAAPEPTSLSGGIETFTGSAQNDPFSSSAPTQSVGLPSVAPTDEFSSTFQDAGFDRPANSFTGSDVSGPSFIANEENILTNDTPVSFSREAGIQHSTKTGNVETLVY